MSISEDPATLAALESFLTRHPTIKYATPTSPGYASLRATFNLGNLSTPLAIVRPQNAEDVAALVKHATSQGTRFVVRSGGGNLFGKSQVQGAITIDMRDIKFVEVDQHKTSARVGGGVLIGDLVTALDKESLATAIGTIPFVGFFGWAAYGGYGPFSSRYGLGVDNILGAKIVNWKGEILEADERLLKGIRGGGGAFGIIVELRIKLYPLNTILSGALMYDSNNNISATFQNFNAGYQELSGAGLPPELALQQAVVNTPDGKMFRVMFHWGSDNEKAGRVYLAKIEKLGTVVMNTVATTTVGGWLKGSQAFVPPGVYGSSRTINLREITPEVTRILGPITAEMPSDPGTMYSVHELRGDSASPQTNSVFGSREPHMMVEFVGTTIEQANAHTSLDWADRAVSALRKTDPGNILPGTYISLDPEGATPLSKIYGANYESLLALKQEHDPEYVFNLAIPALKEFV